jgi:hypothetical protein
MEINKPFHPVSVLVSIQHIFKKNIRAVVNKYHFVYNETDFIAVVRIDDLAGLYEKRQSRRNIEPVGK